MIEFKYPLVKTWTIYTLFIPYMLFMITYEYYTNVIYEKRKDDMTYHYLNICSQIVLGMFCIYFA